MSVIVSSSLQAFSSEPVDFNTFHFKQINPSWEDQGGYFQHLGNESSSNDGTSPLKFSQSFIGIYERHH